MYDINKNIWSETGRPLEKIIYNRFKIKYHYEFDAVLCSFGDWVYAFDVHRVERIDANALIRGE